MSPKLTFGYLYDFRNPAQFDRSWHAVYNETLDVIAWSETVGFGGAWVPEHHLADDGYLPSPIAALSAIAARTNTITIGSSVVLGPLHHPLHFAEDCSFVDNLSGGRLEMALAVGYRRREAQAFGIDFTTRGSRLTEFLQVVRRLWAGETVTFEGKHFTLQGASVTPRPVNGHVPLYIGGLSEPALDRAARLGDGYFGNEEAYGIYCEKLKQAGKDPADARIRLQGIFLTVAADPEKAMDDLAPYYHHANNVYGSWLNEDHALTVDGAPIPKAMSLKDFKASGLLRILTPAEAIAKFRRMQSRLPVEHFMMMMPPGIPAAKFVEYAETFANEVLPAFR